MGKLINKSKPMIFQAEILFRPSKVVLVLVQNTSYLDLEGVQVKWKRHLEFPIQIWHFTSWVGQFRVKLDRFFQIEHILKVKSGSKTKKNTFEFKEYQRRHYPRRRKRACLCKIYYNFLWGFLIHLSQKLSPWFEILYDFYFFGQKSWLKSVLKCRKSSSFVVLKYQIIPCTPPRPLRGVTRL